MKRTHGWMMVVAIGVLFSGSGLPGAEGSIMEFTFSGEIMSIVAQPPAPWDGIAVGSEWSVSYVFDSETPDLNNSPAFGVYDILSLKVIIDGVMQSASGGFIRVETEQPFLQRYGVHFSGLPIGAGGVIRLTGAFALSTDALPTDLNLDDWPISQSFEVGGGGTEIAGGITVFSSRIVPAPGVLFPLALMGMFSRPRKRRR